jgi:hypothetical protein
MKKIFLLTVTLMLLFSVTTSFAKVLATVDGEEITDKMVNLYSDAFKGKADNKIILDTLINRAVIMKEAKKEKYFENIKKQLKKQVGKEVLTGIVIREYLKDKVLKNIKVSDEEIKRVIAHNKGMDRNAAKNQLIMMKAQKNFETLLNSLRKKHKIKVY